MTARTDLYSQMSVQGLNDIYNVVCRELDGVRFDVNRLRENWEESRHSTWKHFRWLGCHLAISALSLISIPITEGYSLIVFLGDMLLLWHEVDELRIAWQEAEDDTGTSQRLARRVQDLSKELADIEAILVSRLPRLEIEAKLPLSSIDVMAIRARTGARVR